MPSTMRNAVERLRGGGALGAVFVSAMVALASSACWQETGPALPDLESSHNEITQRAERLRRIHDLMEEDLKRFEELEEAVVEADGELYEAPFPLDLYKHVAFDCLNEPWSRQDEDDPSSVGGRSLPEPISCRPEFLELLMEVLDQRVPGRQDEALQRLAEVDRLRKLRGQLRWRLARIGPILDDSREMLASRRADLRRLRLSYERRRTEFSSERWARLQESLDAHGDDLDQLQVEISELAEAQPTWPDALDESVKTLYLELSKLRQ